MKKFMELDFKSKIYFIQATVTCTRANEVYSGCGDDGCQRRCDRLDISNCVPKCGSPECICANGYVKNSNGNCVAVSSCRMYQILLK